MYTSTHREGRDSKKQAAGQSRGRLRQRRHSQMQQIKTHANTTVQEDNNSVRDALQWRTSSAVWTHQQAAETPVH